MYWQGHVGLGLLAYAPLAAVALAASRPDLALVGGVFAVGFATLPDLDHYLPIPHRGPTHTIAFALGMGVLAGGATALVADVVMTVPPAWTPLFLGGVTTVTLWSHLAGDLITPMGIRPFRPFSEAHFTLDLTPAKNPRANALFLSVGVIALSMTVMLAV